MINSLSHHVSYPLKWFEIRSLRNLCLQKRAIVLTYDDGPCPRMTTEVLDLLKENGVQATFFVVGNRVDTNLNLLTRIQNEGHEIGSHSMSHLHALEVGRESATADFKSGVGSLVGHGITPTMYRPPYGKILWATRSACNSANCQIAWWTVDSGDSAKHIPSTTHVVDQIKRVGGGVVLMHDLDRSGQSAKKRESHTIETTQALLKLAIDEEYSIVTMGTILGLATGTMTNSS